MSQSIQSEELMNSELQNYLNEILTPSGETLLDNVVKLLAQDDPILGQQQDQPHHDDMLVLPLEPGEVALPRQLRPNPSVHQPAPAGPMRCSPVVSTDEYDGPFHFDVSVIPYSKNGKNTWVYSNKLKKIFIEMGSSFPVDIKITGEPQSQLYVRAMPVFSSPQHSQEPVHRCIHHEQPMEKSNLDIPSDVRQHVIRCQNSNAIYMGDIHKKEKLSVLIPLVDPQIGSDSVREMYVFLCMTSCPSGMNRRPIQVIFTLEDHLGEILGRKVMNARICSCPKRDKEKEEEFQAGSRNETGNPTKKRKKEKVVMNSYTHSQDTRQHQLALTIVGSDNVQSVLKYARDLMAGEALANANTPAEAQFKKCFFRISAQLDAATNADTHANSERIDCFLKKAMAC